MSWGRMSRMVTMFARKPIAELEPPADATQSLKRVLGAGDLVMLAIGTVIGAGIFGAIGTAAAGQVAPDGAVIRYAAGPALIFSFILLGGACALAGASGLYRLADLDAEPQLVVSGSALVGVAFGPGGELVVASNETAYRFE